MMKEILLMIIAMMAFSCSSETYTVVGNDEPEMYRDCRSDHKAMAESKCLENTTHVEPFEYEYCEGEEPCVTMWVDDKWDYCFVTLSRKTCEYIEQYIYGEE